MYVIYLQVSERVDATAFSPVSTQPEVQKKKDSHKRFRTWEPKAGCLCVRNILCIKAINAVKSRHKRGKTGR